MWVHKEPTGSEQAVILFCLPYPNFSPGSNHLPSPGGLSVVMTEVVTKTFCEWGALEQVSTCSHAHFRAAENLQSSAALPATLASTWDVRTLTPKAFGYPVEEQLNRQPGRLTSALRNHKTGECWCLKAQIVFAPTNIQVWLPGQGSAWSQGHSKSIPRFWGRLEAAEKSIMGGGGGHPWDCLSLPLADQIQQQMLWLREMPLRCSQMRIEHNWEHPQIMHILYTKHSQKINAQTKSMMHIRCWPDLCKLSIDGFATLGSLFGGKSIIAELVWWLPLMLWIYPRIACRRKSTSNPSVAPTALCWKLLLVHLHSGVHPALYLLYKTTERNISAQILVVSTALRAPSQWDKILTTIIPHARWTKFSCQFLCNRQVSHHHHYPWC